MTATLHPVKLVWRTESGKEEDMSDRDCVVRQLFEYMILSTQIWPTLTPYTPEQIRWNAVEPINVVWENPKHPSPQQASHTSHCSTKGLHRAAHPHLR